jgi:hypothetical protein
MGNDSIRAVTLIKSIDKERLVLDTTLDSSMGSVEDFFCSIDKDLVNGIRQADPFQKRSKRLHSPNLGLDTECVSEGEEGLEITKCHSCIELAWDTLDIEDDHTSPTTIPVAFHDTAFGMGDSKRL